MKKKFILLLKIGALCVMLAFIAAELLFQLNLLGPRHKYHLTVTPHTLFKVDSLVGWKLNTGKYQLCVWNSNNCVNVTVDSLGNRITSLDDSSIGKRPALQVYGCSFTFGFSVADTATQCFKLQQKLPTVKVENKGVPGYGLAQMYLLLQQTLAAGDTPAIAVFNYGTFHDMRTPLNKNWSARTVRAITEGYNARFRTMNYPYLEFEGDSAELRFSKVQDLAKDWPGSEKIALVKLMNVATYALHDRWIMPHLHQVTVKTALEIARYCKLNHITPVFASLTPGNNEVFDSLAAHGYYTLDYGITVWDHYKANAYNCAPQDPEHPNGNAHSVYAQKLLEFMKQKDLAIR